MHLLLLDTRGAISAFSRWEGARVAILHRSDETLELVIQRHCDSSFTGTGVYMEWLAEGRRLHHAGFSRLVAVVEPHTQRQARLRAAARLWEFGGDDDGVGHVHDVPSDHCTFREPVATCWATRVWSARHNIISLRFLNLSCIIYFNTLLNCGTFAIQQGRLLWFFWLVVKDYGDLSGSCNNIIKKNKQKQNTICVIYYT